MNTAKYEVGADFGFRPATEQEQAEANVRKQRPALMELTRGCILSKQHYGKEVFGQLLQKTKGNFENGGDILGVVFWFNGRKTALKELVPAYKIIGHPINLQDWLAVLVESNNHWDYKLVIRGDGVCFYKQEELLSFNLTTGQPATEADYKAFNQIVNN